MDYTDALTGREQAEQESYGHDPYAQQPQSPPAGYVQDAQQPYFPPPPGAPGYGEYQGQPAPGVAQGGQQNYAEYGYPPQGGYTPPVPNAYSPPPGAAGYPPQQPTGPRRADENVSAETFRNNPETYHDTPTNDIPLYNADGVPIYFDPIYASGEGGCSPRHNTQSDSKHRMLTPTASGLKTPRAQSPSAHQRSSSQPPPKSVHFDTTPSSSVPSSPAQIRQRRERTGTSRHHDGYESEGGSSPRHKPSRNNETHTARRHDRHHHSISDTRNPSPTESDSTVDLPARFDERGRRILGPEEDPLAERIQELLNGRGSVSRTLQSFGLVGGGSDDSDGNRRRQRRKR